MNPDWSKPQNLIHFPMLNEPLEELVKATIERIRREWPSTLGKPAHAVAFQFMLKHAWWIYRCSRFLVADIPKDALRRPEFALGLAPLSRTILDAVFNVVFIFDDYPLRLCWYLDSGLKEVERNFSRYAATYAGDPKWTQWLAEAPKFKQVFIESRDEVCAKGAALPKGCFPHPGAILGQQQLNDATLRPFLMYLNDWTYRELSSAAHGHWAGLVQNIGQVLRVESGTEEDLAINLKFRSDSVLQTMTFLLCLVSEIIAKANFQGKERALIVWGLLAPISDDAKYLADSRYRALLASTAVHS